MSEHPIRILLIDDNRRGTAARQQVLESRGYSIVTAGGGREGVACFDAQAFDIVVTDYRMPDLRGIQVLRKIRERNAKVPVIILSGYVNRLGLTPESTGASAVVSKGPQEMPDLLRAIAGLAPRKKHRPTVSAVSSRCEESIA